METKVSALRLLVSLSKSGWPAAQRRSTNPIFFGVYLRHALPPFSHEFSCIFGSSQRATVSGTIDNFIIIIERTLFLLVQLARRRYNTRMRVRKINVVKLLWSVEMVKLLVHISGVTA